MYVSLVLHSRLVWLHELKTFIVCFYGRIISWLLPQASCCKHVKNSQQLFKSLSCKMQKCCSRRVSKAYMSNSRLLELIYCLFSASNAVGHFCSHCTKGPSLPFLNNRQYSLTTVHCTPKVYFSCLLEMLLGLFCSYYVKIPQTDLCYFPMIPCAHQCLLSWPSPLRALWE